MMLKNAFKRDPPMTVPRWYFIILPNVKQSPFSDCCKYHWVALPEIMKLTKNKILDYMNLWGIANPKWTRWCSAITKGNLVLKWGKCRFREGLGRSYSWMPNVGKRWEWWDLLCLKWRPESKTWISMIERPIQLTMLKTTPSIWFFSWTKE